jgi:hypothetical protein
MRRVRELEVGLARKKTTGVAETTLADQVAEYVGKSLGDLLNRRDSLLKEVATIDAQVAAVSKKVAKQFGKWVPYRTVDAPVAKAAKAGKAGSKRQRRKFSAEQRAEVSERMRKYWAARRKAGAKG